ncbi:hypothetical protein ACI2KR_30110 [Pseudomonas luteola]
MGPDIFLEKFRKDDFEAHLSPEGKGRRCKRDIEKSGVGYDSIGHFRYAYKILAILESAHCEQDGNESIVEGEFHELVPDALKRAKDMAFRQSWDCVKISREEFVEMLDRLLDETNFATEIVAFHSGQ